MYSKIKKVAISGVAVLFVIACSNALYTPTVADSNRVGISVDTLRLGRALYIKNCASCHALFPPTKYAKHEWERVMPSMKTMAKCSDQEAQIILSYVNAHAKNE